MLPQIVLIVSMHFAGGTEGWLLLMRTLQTLTSTSTNIPTTKDTFIPFSGF